MRFGKASGDFQRVEMMMTPMIDVCFMMIMFFIVNMRIFSPEGNFNIEMPAASAQAGVASDDAQIPPINIRLRADKDGNLAGIRMGQRPIRTFKDLRREIRQLCGADRGPAAASANPEVEFECDYNLKYEYVVDAVTAISGYLANDDQTVVRMIEKIRFAPPQEQKRKSRSMAYIETPFLPLVEELAPAPDPEEVFLRMARAAALPVSRQCHASPAAGAIFLPGGRPVRLRAISGRRQRRLGGLGPADGPTHHGTALPDLPPFQGGAAGLLSYDLGRSLESVPPPAVDEFRVPALAMGFYDVVVAFDHVAGRAWIISQGLPEIEPSRRRQACRGTARPGSRLDRRRLGRQLHCHPRRSATAGARRLCRTVAARPIWRPSIRSPASPGVTSNFSKQGYLEAVQRVIDYIYAGDVFQVNLSQRLLAPARDDSVSLYRRLRRCNPAPMAGYFDLGQFQILSASPERFLRVDHGQVETRPIKGTRPRSRRSGRRPGGRSRVARPAKRIAPRT